MKVRIKDLRIGDLVHVSIDAWFDTTPDSLKTYYVFLGFQLSDDLGSKFAFMPWLPNVGSTVVYLYDRDLRIRLIQRVEA